MNNRYIDFVPNKKTGAAPIRRTTVVMQSRRVSSEVAEPVDRVEPVDKVEPERARPTRRVRPAGQRVVSDMVQKRPRKVMREVQPKLVAKPPVKPSVKPVAKLEPKPTPGAKAQPQPAVAPKPRALVRKTRPVENTVLDEAFLEHEILEHPILDDPLEKPISEFTDLEELAQEIAEVTQNDPVIDAEEISSEGEAFSLKQAPQYGVVENFQPRFVQTEVEKRPLSAGYAATEAQTVTPPKAAPVTTAAPESAKKPHRMARRPLAKSVNQANLNTAAAKPTPAMSAAVPQQKQIVSEKPKKGSKIGMVLAVIGTIILGAAVGTVAFLLLPK